jgi:uncharacterized protein (DUF924 family)
MTMSDEPRPGWQKEVLDFWFRELTPKARFEKSAVTDDTIRQRFLGLYEALAQEGVPSECGAPLDVLARVIVLDQFPRNMFRGTPRAFATDPLALAIAESAVRDKLDVELDPQQRTFLYLPFEHSEDASVQARSVQLLSSLGDGEITRYAVAHKVIIDRFGRFPHRNAILGRRSTPEEIEFLQEPGSSF